MSHYKPYPAYKNSGVEWLGEVPEHWVVARFRDVCTSICTGPFGTALGNDAYVAGGVPVINPSHIVNEQCCPDDEISISVETAERLKFWTMQVGDIVTARRGELGRSAVITPEQDGWICGTGSLRVRPMPDRVTARYLHTVLQSNYARDWLNLSSVGSTMANLNEGILGQLPVALPEVAEQKEIATHLDRETARIDALVAKKTRFIELLREKRQALITHAVTKGLDPSVKMKGSGVEWLGEVPEHWELVPLKYLTPSLTVGIVVNPSDYVSDEGLPFLYGGDIGEGEIYAETARRISREDSQRNAKTRLMAGDLVTVRVGAPGVTAVVPPECEGGNCASVMLIRRGHFESDWLCYVMNSRVVRYQVEVVQYGAAQEQFNISHAVDFLIPVPPREEQAAIAFALNQERKRVDALLRKTEHSITLLKERRSALITAAVTGQIDLRETA